MGPTLCKLGILVTALSGVALWVSQPSTAQTIPTGEWTAIVDAPDGNTVEAPVTMAADGDGYTATLRVPEIGDMPFEDFTVRGTGITFSWNAGVMLQCMLERQPEGIYSGTCSDRGSGTGRIQLLPPGVERTVEAFAPLDPGTVLWGTNEWIEYQAGGLPLILSSPHGGNLEPAAIRDRTNGYNIGDSDTQELTRLIADELANLTGRRPHLVINRLHRKKLDANRAIDEAANGDPGSEQAWDDYHGFIDTAREQVAAAWEYGLYLDIHGHGHRTPWVELGYALMPSALNGDDANLDRQEHTMQALTGRTGIAVSELVRGPASLGALLEARGYRSVPSPGDPGPGGADYFNGGFSSVRHGSLRRGAIDSIQVEHPKRGVREPEADRRAYAKIFAEVLVEFLETHYGFDLVAS